jgi:hypothetical protein
MPVAQIFRGNGLKDQGLQQRALSGIFTRFPIMFFLRYKKRTTVAVANIEYRPYKNHPEEKNLFTE